MAKDKKASKAAAPAPKPAVSKPIQSVKAGRVSKPAERVKAVAKDTAKKTAKVVEKSSKKGKKEPTPVDDDTSSSSASSDEESEDEVDTKAPAKVNGAAKGAAAKKDESDSESGSDSESDSGSDASDSDESDEEVATKKTAAPKINGSARLETEDDSSSASDSEDEATPKVNGKAATTSDSEDDSEDESESDSGSDAESDAKPDSKNAADSKMKDDDDSSDASSDASDSDEEEEKPKVEEKKKRKADDSFDHAPKKSKVLVNGEHKDPVSNLFVGNLSWNIDEEWLTREFEEYGELKSVRIITDRDSGRSKGFGYVEFVSVDSAITAIEEKNGGLVDGRDIRIDFSAPRPPRDNNDQTPKQRGFDRAAKYGDTPSEPSSTIFVGNVSFRADESMVTELFQDYGTVNAVRLPTDQSTGELKGFGYVEFGSIDEAKAAFEGLQGADLAGRQMRLDYSKPRDPNSSPRQSFGGRGGGGFDRGRGRGGRGGFNDRGRGGGRGGSRGGRGGFTTNRGGFGDFSGKKTTF